jgi:transcriptional regulator with XRE-family HTH domain
MSDLPDDTGHRITAARAYAGLSQEALADSLGITVPALQRIEAGLAEQSTEDEWAILRGVSAATRVPLQAFTVDFGLLDGTAPPEARLAQLEQKIDQALARMDQVAKEADFQMTRGKQQLDRFIEAQQSDRDLLRRIADHVGVPPEST